MNVHIIFVLYKYFVKLEKICNTKQTKQEFKTFFIESEGKPKYFFICRVIFLNLPKQH